MARVTHGSIWNAIEKDPVQARAMERKALILMKVQEKLKANKWTQVEAAKHLGVQQPRVSDIMQGKISRFTLDMLVTFLDRLDQPVVLTFPTRSRPRKSDHV